MKTLYIECNMGAAGDMLMAALLEICPDKGAFLKKMNELSLPGVQVSRYDATKCGIKGTGISVKINGMQEGESTQTIITRILIRRMSIIIHMRNTHIHTKMGILIRRAINMGIKQAITIMQE